MNINLKSLSCVIISLLGLLTFSCNIGGLDFDNIEKPTFKPEVVAPVGEVTYTIKELIQKINDPSIEISEANDLLLSIIYRDTSIYNTLEELIKIDEVSQQKVLEPGIIITNTPVDVSEVFLQTLSFEYSDYGFEQIDSVMYASGNLEITVNSQIPANVALEIKLIDFVDQVTRDTIVFNSSLSYNGSLPVSQVFSQDLSGYRTKLRTSSAKNLFDIVFTGAINLKAGQSVNTADFILISVSTGNTVFSGVAGYFGEDDIIIHDQIIDIEFFNDIEPFGLELSNPQIILNFENSFGVPIGVNLEGITATNINGDIRQLSGAIIENMQPIKAPSISEYGKKINSAIVISNEISNLRELFSLTPSRLTIPISAKTNFKNEDKEPNFYTQDSQLKTILEVNLPLDVKLGGYSQLFDFSLDNINLDDADSIKLRVTTINELPFNGSFDLFLLDADSTVIYQIPENLILISPEVGANRRTVEPAKSVDDVVLNTDGIAAMNKATKVVFILTIDSYKADDDRFVRIFSDYELTIKLGVIGNINYKLQ
jgi:hypothetical protein